MNFFKRTIGIWCGLLLLCAVPVSGQTPKSFNKIKKALMAERQAAEALQAAETDQKDGAVRLKMATTTMFTDDFNDGVIDPAAWITSLVAPDEQGGVLSMNPTTTASIITAQMVPTLTATVKDLVVNVDFTSFSSTGSGEAGLFVFADTFFADFTLDHVGGRRAVLYVENDDGSKKVHYHWPTSATTGSLRLVYHHNTRILEGFLKEGETWRKVGDTVGISLGNFSSVNVALFASAEHPDTVSASFDNFLAQALSPPPAAAVRKRLWTLY